MLTCENAELTVTAGGPYRPRRSKQSRWSTREGRTSDRDAARRTGREGTGRIREDPIGSHHRTGREARSVARTEPPQGGPDGGSAGDRAPRGETEPRRWRSAARRSNTGRPAAARRPRRLLGAPEPEGP